MTGLKGCKKYQKKKKIFHFPKLKENWLKKNEWNLSNQSGEVTHASMYLKNCRRSFIFFQLSYLEHDVMITNLVRLNLMF